MPGWTDTCAKNPEPSGITSPSGAGTAIAQRLYAAICLPGPVYAREYAGHPLLTLKCDPLESELLRAACPDILPGFYTDKRTWISIRLDGGVERERILRLCDASYDLVFARLTRRARMEIMDGGT